MTQRTLEGGDSKDTDFSCIEFSTVLGSRGKTAFICKYPKRRMKVDSKGGRDS